MIVVVIIGIIAAIAFPRYQEQVQSTRRTTAEADLTELAQFMERQYTDGYDYRQQDGTPPVLPFFTQPRGGGGTIFYNYSIENIARTTFTIRATPAGPQAAEDCGWLEITETGARSSENAAAECW